ncbi:MAG TPA: sulfotransferase, partial [Bryobacteraceae bacterium]
MERFFILGCQRTGTTLLRLILEGHPEVVCYDEMKGYAVLQNSVVENLSPARLIGFKLPRWTEQLTRPTLSDEGVEGFCQNFYRGEKILFLQRDVRDTIASMMKLRAGRSSWCELWVPRIIRAKLARESEFRTRYAAELSILEKCGLPLVGMAALYWKYKSDAFYDYQEAGLPVLGVSYEHLVLDPRVVLQAVCRHLGIAFHPNLLQHEQLPHTELFENGLTVGNTNPKQA